MYKTSGIIDSKVTDKTIVVIGDSVTHSEESGGRTWPVILQDFIDRDKSLNYKILDFSMTGTTSSFANRYIEEILKHNSPEIVISMVGMADSSLLALREDISFLNNIKTLRFLRAVYINLFYEKEDFLNTGGLNVKNSKILFPSDVLFRVPSLSAYLNRYSEKMNFHYSKLANSKVWNDFLDVQYSRLFLFPIIYDSENVKFPESKNEDELAKNLSKHYYCNYDFYNWSSQVKTHVQSDSLRNKNEACIQMYEKALEKNILMVDDSHYQVKTKFERFIKAVSLGEFYIYNSQDFFEKNNRLISEKEEMINVLKGVEYYYKALEIYDDPIIMGDLVNLFIRYEMYDNVLDLLKKYDIPLLNVQWEYWERLHTKGVLPQKYLKKLKSFGYNLNAKATSLGVVTSNNLISFNNKLKERSIKHFSMQYPNLPLATLKRFYSEEKGVVPAHITHHALEPIKVQSSNQNQGNIQFIENFVSFSFLVSRYGYDAFFTDSIGNVTGHLNEHGHGVVAYNVYMHLKKMQPKRLFTRKIISEKVDSISRKRVKQFKTQLTNKGLWFPSVKAILNYLEPLELTNKDRVLEIGTGLGYITALISTMAKETHTIDLASQQQNKVKSFFQKEGFRFVFFHVGDGFKVTLREKGYFDKIVCNVVQDEIELDFLFSKLRIGGKLVTPSPNNNDNYILYTKKKSGMTKQLYLGHFKGE